MTQPDDVAQLRRDHTALASSISVMTQELGAMKTERAIEKAVAVERQTSLDDRLDRIEKGLDGLNGLGKWILGAFFAALIAAFVGFLVNGGLNVPGA